ncbi:choline dehydrogenase [Microbacterium limosum]|uniref:Choline dehydrogenase n=1 Tax=Microbacterium limosum TaxID=3079935 RepID=A0AAU0MIT3_9MICO|nr:choline dehydrogenase [Microbacterium sp. Y20]WOQ70061.1 choline dehydrogenase [Microbacterium sp. Y20]
MTTQTFDYVIIGAGAAGCVLANRLSADPSVNVLLLEAGGADSSMLVKIPAGFGKVMGTAVNWIFDTAPQKHLHDRTMFLPQGKVLGGSTSINAMLYVRGNRDDYDGWRDKGNVGWGYDDVLPYFTVHERNERIADGFHGTTGELNVADQVQTNPLSKAFVRASQQAGIPYTSDPNGAEQTGVFYHQVTQRGAKRESASTAFLRPVAQRRNLTILTGAEVTRIVVEDGVATGATYTHGRETTTVRARREVIVSAGAINSPRLLLLSGIGPADELREAGIEPVHDLPGVGKNLHDQLEVYITVESQQPISYTGEDRALRMLGHGIQYTLYKTGPATATVTEAGAFVRSDPALAQPDIQLHMLPVIVKWKDGARTAEKVTGHGFTILACAIRPRSRGEVRVTSADPSVPPIVDPNYMADEEDWKTSVAGLRIIRDILSQPAFAPYVKSETMPGSDVTTDADLRAYITEWGKTDYHPVGSCRMGVDDLAVVDPELRVRGLKNLRVIDSSIMPDIISGNTQAPAMMIGEKGAALILGTKAPVAR